MNHGVAGWKPQMATATGAQCRADRAQEQCRNAQEKGTLSNVLTGGCLRSSRRLTYGCVSDCGMDDDLARGSKVRFELDSEDMSAVSGGQCKRQTTLSLVN